MFAHFFHQLVVYVGNNTILSSVVFDEHMQRVAARNPANQTSVLTQWYNGVPSYTQVFFACLSVYLE